MSKVHGEIVDIPFPNVDPLGDEEYIRNLCKEYEQKIKEIADGKEASIHIMGEMTFSFSLINLLKSQGYSCVASTSKRMVIEREVGKKEILFEFVRFRQY